MQVEGDSGVKLRSDLTCRERAEEKGLPLEMEVC